MRVVGRKSVSGVGGFNIQKSRGGVIPHLRHALTTDGRGLTKEYYENTSVSHPFKSLGKGNAKNTLESIKIKPSNPKKYISFNR